MRMREMISLSNDISELPKCRLHAGVCHLKATRGQAWQPEGLMCLRTGDQAVSRVSAFFLSEYHFWGRKWAPPITKGDDRGARLLVPRLF